MDKEKPNPDDLIKWSAVSKLLTGKHQNIRKDDIPSKWLLDINMLRYHISKFITSVLEQKKE